MKMIWAVIRPESAHRVVRALDTAGIGGITRIHVTGHGKKREVTPGSVNSKEIPQEMLMIVVPDYEVAKTVTLIRAEAKTGPEHASGEGTNGDGRIFVTYVEDSFAIRTISKTAGNPK